MRGCEMEQAPFAPLGKAATHKNTLDNSFSVEQVLRLPCCSHLEGLQDWSLKAQDADVGCSGAGDQKVWAQGSLGGGSQRNHRITEMAEEHQERDQRAPPPS